MDSLEKKVIAKFIHEGWGLAVAESCTGGYLGNRITDVPGSSQVFWGGVMAYENSAKLSLLEVSPGSLEVFGAISGEIAAEMAIGVLRKMEEAYLTFRSPKPLWKKRIAIATTGIAGPSGGTEKKPVGTCFFSLVTNGGQRLSEKIQAVSSLSRIEIKKAFAQRALEILLRL